MGSLGGDWLMFVHMASPCTWPHTNLKAGQPQALQHRLPRGPLSLWTLLDSTRVLSIWHLWPTFTGAVWHLLHPPPPAPANTGGSLA